MARNLVVRISAASALLALLLSTSAHAIWLPMGSPVCVEPHRQELSDVSPDGAGGILVVWTDLRHLGPAQFDLYAQRLTALGDRAPGWPVDGAPVCLAANNQSAPVIVSDGTGGAFVAWEDDRVFDSDVYLQHIAANGTIAPGWPPDGLPVCTATNFQMPPRLAPDGVGGVYVAWIDYRPGEAQRDVYAQHVTAGGALVPGWPADGLAVCTAPNIQEDVGIASDGAGGAILSWDDNRTGVAMDSRIFAARLTPSGALAPGWIANGTPVCSGSGRALQPRMVADGSGGAYIVWLDERSGPDTDLYGLHMLGDGSRAPGWVLNGLPISNAAAQQMNPRLAADGFGGLLMAWDDTRSGGNMDVYAIRIAAIGTPAPGWTPNGVLITTQPDYQQSADVAPDGTGGMFVTWSQSSGTYGAVAAKHLEADASLAPGWTAQGQLLIGGPGDPIFSGGQRIVPSSGGGAIVAWQDLRNGFWYEPIPNLDLFAQRLTPDGIVATEVSLVSSEVASDHVALTWFSAATTLVDASAYRRRADSDWTRLGSADVDGTGHIRYEDRTVTAGERYAYRLGYIESGAERFTAESWVETPGAIGLSLFGATPNPSARRINASFALPDAGPASLELLDAGGRRVLARDVGALGAGRHVVELGSERALPPGLYLLRLTRSQRVLTRKVAVVE